MRIFDAHRLIGPLPAVPHSGGLNDVLDDLDRLGIASAAVTPTWMLYGDARSAAEYEHVSGWDRLTHARLVRVPVVVPGVAGSGVPVASSELVGAPVVRACPERHRFDALGPVAVRWWHELAEIGTVLAIDASECGLRTVGALAAAVPTLRLLVLTPGYRELRRLAELLDAAPGVHVETGTVASAGAVEWLARVAGAHRLVFGTGAPLWDDAGPRFQLDDLDLPDEDVELIAHGSWDRLVGGVA